MSKTRPSRKYPKRATPHNFRPLKLVTPWEKREQQSQHSLWLMAPQCYIHQRWCSTVLCAWHRCHFLVEYDDEGNILSGIYPDDPGYPEEKRGQEDVLLAGQVQNDSMNMCFDKMMQDYQHYANDKKEERTVQDVKSQWALHRIRTAIRNKKNETGRHWLHTF